VSRPGSIVDFAQVFGVELGNLVDRLRDTLGRVTALVDFAMLRSATGVALGPSTALAGSHVTVDLADARLDQARLCVGGTSAGGCTVQIIDTASGRVLVTTALPAGGSAAPVTPGEWAVLPALAGDRVLVARNAGPGSVTLFSLVLQLRTLRG
jgi:hypothetical protein